MNDKETKGTRETEGAKWRIGVVSAAPENSLLVSDLLADDEIAGLMRRLAETLPPGFRAFAFASGEDPDFDAGVGRAVAMSLIELRSGFSGGEWFVDGVVRHARFLDRAEHDRLVATERRNELLAIDVNHWRSRARSGWVCALIFFGLFAAAVVTTCARGAIRKQPALQEQHDKSGEDGHEKPVAARGETGNGLALLPGALLGVEGGESVEGRLEGRGSDGAADFVAKDGAANKTLVDQAGEGNGLFPVVGRRDDAGTAGEAGEVWRIGCRSWPRSLAETLTSCHPMNCEEGETR